MQRLRIRNSLTSAKYVSFFDQRDGSYSYSSSSFLQKQARRWRPWVQVRSSDIDNDDDVPVFFFFISIASSTTTYSSGNCRLNCQNGGTPETDNGCFCYCPPNTLGRECEESNWSRFHASQNWVLCFSLVDCSQGSDTDTDLCSTDNEPLCSISDLFAYECVHLCGKCWK